MHISIDELSQTESELIQAIASDERFTVKIREQAIRMVRQRFMLERERSALQTSKDALIK